MHAKSQIAASTRRMQAVPIPYVEPAVNSQPGFRREGYRAERAGHQNKISSRVQKERNRQTDKETQKQAQPAKLRDRDTQTNQQTDRQTDRTDK